MIGDNLYDKRWPHRVPREGRIEFIEYAPVTADGEFWVPRSEEECKRLIDEYREYPTFSDGVDRNGPVKCMKRRVVIEVSPWEEVD